MDATTETVLLVGLAWIAFKGLLTVLLLLGAGRLLRRTPLAPLVVRMEARLPFVRRAARLPWSRQDADASRSPNHDVQSSELTPH